MAKIDALKRIFEIQGHLAYLTLSAEYYCLIGSIGQEKEDKLKNLHEALYYSRIAVKYLQDTKNEALILGIKTHYAEQSAFSSRVSTALELALHYAADGKLEDASRYAEEARQFLPKMQKRRQSHDLISQIIELESLLEPAAETAASSHPSDQTL